MPADLLRYPLLHSHYRRRDWPDWLEAAGVAIAETQEPLMFPSSLLTYQAALDGLGIAMGQPAMLETELRSGSLVCPIDRPLRRDHHRHRDHSACRSSGTALKRSATRP